MARLLRIAHFGRVVWLIGVSLSTVTGQTNDQSASDLIKYLTYQTKRPEVVAVSCGIFAAMDAENRAAAQSLVKLGAAALPDINAAFDSIEQSGSASKSGYNAAWLLFAYAKIEGPGAFPRLRKMRGDPNFAFLNSAVDLAIALSLNATSYVSGWRRPAQEGVCTGPDPRKVLDGLILAWVNNDRASLEKILGSRASTALDALLKNTTWDALRAQFLHAKPSDKIAVGYRFDAAGRWSAAVETLDDPDVSAWRIEDLDINTLFSDGSGKDCGRLRISFRSPDFSIDNSDLGDLLRVISRCAAHP